MGDPTNMPIPLPEGADPGATLGLGRFVCERASRLLYWLIAGVFMFMAGSTGLGAMGMLLKRPPDYVACAIGLGFFAGLAALVFLCVRQARTTFRFYELGAVELIGRTPRTVIEWVEASELTYKVVKQSYHGVHLSTAVTIQIKTDDKRKLSFTGTHRTKVKGKGLFGGGVAEVVRIDELDVVRDLVSEAIADRMGDRLLAGDRVEWCRAGVLSDVGFTPKRGRYKGELVPYGQIDREAADNGGFALFRAGEERAFITVPMALPNFWPGVVLIHRMIGVVGAEGEGLEEGAVQRSE